MDKNRKTATLVGIFFIIGTVSGIASGIVTLPFLEAPDYLNQIADNANQMVMGSLLVLLMGFPLAMIPVLMYPIFKHINEVLALGAVIFRGVLEAFCYIVLVISMLLLLTLSQGYASAGAPDVPYFQTLGALLQEAGMWINLVLAIVFALGALMLYYLFYRSRLVPRWLSGWGLIGGLLYLAAPVVVMFDAQNLTLSVTSPVTGFLLVPLAIQEMVFAVWLIVKGFNSTAIAVETA